MRYTNVALPFGATLIIYAMAYLGLRKPEALRGAEDGDAARPAEPSSAPAKKYEKSTLTSERAEAYLKRLLGVMERERPYTDGDLTLPKLATRLSISPHHLSQLINERLNQNFFDFVNAYRVEEAKRQLRDDAKSHYTLLAIAEEVGFNSKSAFNAAFKKQTHTTPSDYRKARGAVEHPL
jgi:AraC-like DNA-binding protein